MNLLDFGAETESGSLMQVYHPSSNKPIEGLTATIRSFQHSEVQAVVKKQQARAAMRVGRDGKPVELTEEDTERNAVELYDALIESWTGFEIDDRVLSPNKEGIKEVMNLKKTHGKNFDFFFIDVMNWASNVGNYFRPDDAGGDLAEASRVAAHKAGKGHKDAG